MSELRLLGAQIIDVPGMRRHLERIACDDADAVGLQASDLLGIVGEQADALDTEVAQDLRADAVVAHVLREAQLEFRLGRIPPAILQRIRADLVGESDATALLMQADEDALSRRGDALQRLRQLLAAIATLRAEHVAREALRVQ